MNSKYTLALFGLFVVVVGLAVYVARSGREPVDLAAGTPTPTPSPLLELEAPAVQEVALDGSDGELTLNRAAGGWEIDGEPAADTVSGAIDRLTDVQVTRILPDDTDPEDYGFATPTFTVTLRTQDGADHVLVFGDDTPIGGSVYVRLGGEGTIFVVSNADVTAMRGWIASPPLAPTPTVEGAAEEAYPPAPDGTPTAAGDEPPAPDSTPTAAGADAPAVGGTEPAVGGTEIVPTSTTSPTPEADVGGTATPTAES